MDNFTRTAGRADVSQRKIALIAGLGLLGMAVLAQLALFGVFEGLADEPSAIGRPMIGQAESAPVAS